MASEKEIEIAAIVEQHIQLHADNEATEYSIETNVDDNSLRLRFYNCDGVLCSYTMVAAEAYDLAQRILRGYDRLEGL